ncbi:HAMP domain-containing sensor histidine kinase [Mangrovibacterium lignilyticum]|uniref:HAMP domain-containing sensor histidine kinase n=1 Tax=Mangrovibacterium lignilyticum TaxID=2668052 RepID=UPI0019689417|nr:HAMP domain-containing sensor histidine kinase [Mangrovibacterium lignilyticum]
MFTFFTLYYFPEQQRKALLKNYNTEVQNLVNSVALGVNIALTDQNFENLGAAVQLVKDDSRLKFVSMVQCDTVWNEDHTSFTIEKSVFRTFPATENPDPYIESFEGLVIKRGTYNTPIIWGDIILAFTTNEINRSEMKIRYTSLIVSGFVLFIGLLLGFLLSRKISVPVLALRDAARKVGEGNLNLKVHIKSSDEIGELGNAFNKMVEDLSNTKNELEENYKELAQTNTTLKITLSELKSAQAQLVQAEKMASLGELTAGIAHEIQNPLNFVNNFSEVSNEMMDEMNEELNKGDVEEARAISNDIKQNLEKINHHGKRADAIVKGMLQHSRTSVGPKELTDINALADEYLRLSYHGFRAKDKSFNADFKLEVEDNIPMINIVPQDIGRVLLNLINNAFYAVAEKAKQNIIDYSPYVIVRIKNLKNKIEIKVNDNGDGIPDSVKEKIFQPFFTTKPTGQGTGLGLSLSYDIVKAHGGELRLESDSKTGTTFIITLNEV